ncbi:MAG: hypothetical protein NTX39_00310, partial [Opitutae bacterium]|nr:hypothetical protein [Opitutae bacterium]
MRASRYFLILIAGLSLALGVQAAPTKAYTIAVVPMGTTHEYWKMIHAGALQAQAELRASGLAVDIIWKGPL